MKTKPRLLLYSFLFLMIINFISVDSIFAQTVVPFPEQPNVPTGDSRDYWQEGYDYGFRLGRYYATSGQLQSIVIYKGTVK